MPGSFTRCLPLLVILTLFTGCTPKPPETAEPVLKEITIGTGGVTGVYYPTGGAISKMINQKEDLYGIRASVRSTPGSVYNIDALMEGIIDFGIVQSDIQYQAWKGMNDWETSGPQTGLRSLFSIHPESITLLAADDSGILSIEDVKGKSVSIGNPGSGQRENAIDVLNLFGIDWQKDITASGYKSSEAASMLQKGEIDAYFFTVGHPNASLQEATRGERRAHFVPIPVSGEILLERPYYIAYYIPVSYYPDTANDQDVETLGVKATLCTRADVSDDIVYALTREIFENLEDFKKLHPAFAHLTPLNMLSGLTAPIHEGAMKYYREAGLK